MCSKQEQAALEARRQYHRNWRARNKDRVKKYNQNFWLRKAEQQARDSQDTGEGD